MPRGPTAALLACLTSRPLLAQEACHHGTCLDEIDEDFSELALHRSSPASPDASELEISDADTVASDEAIHSMRALGSSGVYAELMAQVMKMRNDSNKKNYSGEHWYDEPERWYKEYPDCAGNRQSPIALSYQKSTDIKVQKDIPVEDRHGPMLSFSYTPLKSGLALKNNGHTLQADLNMGSMSLDDEYIKYKVLNFHFHSPSEHTINGTRYDLEMHIVHQRANTSGNQGLAVAVFMFRADAADRWIQNFRLKDTPTKGQETKTMDNFTFCGRSGLTWALDHNYFYYEGSLTTPPCSETVKWLVFDTVGVIADKALKGFKAQFPDPSNSRPLQPRNNRVVKFFNATKHRPPGVPKSPQEQAKTDKLHYAVSSSSSSSSKKGMKAASPAQKKAMKKAMKKAKAAPAQEVAMKEFMKAATPAQKKAMKAMAKLLRTTTSPPLSSNVAAPAAIELNRQPPPIGGSTQPGVQVGL